MTAGLVHVPFELSRGLGLMQEPATRQLNCPLVIEGLLYPNAQSVIARRGTLELSTVRGTFYEKE